MKYQIKYELTGRAKRMTVGKLWVKYSLTALAMAGLVGIFLWSQGCDWQVTVGALERLAENLTQGSDLQEAFSCFCLDVMWGAQSG